MIIHQRRAHIRIEYERIMDLIADSTLESQSLIFAEDIELPSSQSSLLQGVDKELASLGFRIRHNASLRWSIEAVPAILKTYHLPKLFRQSSTICLPKTVPGIISSSPWRWHWLARQRFQPIRIFRRARSPQYSGGLHSATLRHTHPTDYLRLW